MRGIRRIDRHNGLAATRSTHYCSRCVNYARKLDGSMEVRVGNRVHHRNCPCVNPVVAEQGAVYASSAVAAGRSR